MPPRKSDSSRRNDVTMAKFVLNDPEGPVPAAAAAVPPLAPSPVPAPVVRPGSTPVAADPVEMDTDRPSESAPPSDRRSDKDARDAVAIEDLNLPKSIITRLAKGVLPPNTQIQANAILAMTKGATVFISHLANAYVPLPPAPPAARDGTDVGVVVLTRV